MQFTQFLDLDIVIELACFFYLIFYSILYRFCVLFELVLLLQSIEILANIPHKYCLHIRPAIIAVVKQPLINFKFRIPNIFKQFNNLKDIIDNTTTSLKHLQFHWTIFFTFILMLLAFKMQIWFGGGAIVFSFIFLFNADQMILQ